jgi:pyridinium-3,5-bisthiocarboxylic acid mononucleotide nickel chelatase
VKTLYFDCHAGIAGDMTVAALLDLGVPLELLREHLALLPLSTDLYKLTVSRVARKGITATHFDVSTAHEHHHRRYADIAAMIDRSGLPVGVREKAGRIFLRLAEAEAKVHGVEIGEVHFHEVGAVDSIIDIVGTAIGLDYLGIDAIHASPLPYGSGFVQTAHGRLPVPAPATAELLRGMPVHFESGSGERVTPTGAAILAALADGFGPPPAMRVEAVGCGAGTKDFDDLPNILRIVMGESEGSFLKDEILVLETHIDDMNPEILGYLMEKLLAQGALDVAYAPIQMKKNRPGVKLTLLTHRDGLDKLSRLVLTESTSAGIRYFPAERLMLARTEEERETSLGRLRVKVFHDGGRPLRVVPEFEECRRVASERGLTLLEVYRIVERETSLT